ncbi:type II toxin-antitoxin system RelE/ParE family toxin [Succinivibrio dextrinosolvens]
MRRLSANISRVMYFFYIGDTATLTNGSVKKTQKTPIKEIEKALKYR